MTIPQSLIVIFLALCLAFAGCAPERPEWRVLCVSGKAEGMCLTAD